MHHAVTILESAHQALLAGQPVALCAVVGSGGSTPQAPGALMLLHGDTRTEGTLGGGCVEAEVRRQALTLLQRGDARLLTFKLDHDYGWDDGLICGGRLDVAVMTLRADVHAALLAKAAGDLRRHAEVTLPLRVHTDEGPVEYHVLLEAVPTLLIAGGGHVGQELARQAVRLDFRVRVCDDRADILSPARFPDPIERIVGPIAERLAAEPIDAGTYIVIVTRGHRHDEQALHAVICSPARYIGMIGSRRKIKLIFDDLVTLGVAPELLRRVHAPIGVPIDAVTVPEIGISIAAELVAERRRGRRKTRLVSGPHPAGGRNAASGWCSASKEVGRSGSRP